jgi:hypothetical protein
MKIGFLSLVSIITVIVLAAADFLYLKVWAEESKILPRPNLARHDDAHEPSPFY